MIVIMCLVMNDRNSSLRGTRSIVIGSVIAVVSGAFWNGIMYDSWKTVKIPLIHARSLFRTRSTKEFKIFGIPSFVRETRSLGNIGFPAMKLKILTLKDFI